MKEKQWYLHKCVGVIAFTEVEKNFFWSYFITFKFKTFYGKYKFSWKVFFPLSSYNSLTKETQTENPSTAT